MDSRSEFERAVKSKWSDSYIFNLEASGCYVDEILEAMFWAWQVSRQALEGEAVKWTAEMPANESIRYNHVTAETPFGRFEITWKGWKEHDSPTVDETPWGDYFGAFSTVDEAKAACELEYSRRICIACPAGSQAFEGGAEVVDVERIADTVRDNLGDIFACTRAWPAWQVGTMTEDDFTPAGETELADEIAAAVAEIYTHPASTSGERVWEMAMMAAIGEDGPKSVADAIGKLKAGSVPEGWRIEPFYGFDGQGISVLWPDGRGGAHIRTNDPNNSIAHDVLHDLAQALVFGSQPDSAETVIPVSRLGQRKAAQVGTTIGVLVQTPAGSVAAVTDLGRCTWLNQDVTGASLPAHKRVYEYDGAFECVDCGSQWGALLGTPKESAECTPRKADEPPSVPDAEYTRVLQDALDIIQADANTDQNFGSLCRIGSVLARLKSEQEPSQ